MNTPSFVCAALFLATLAACAAPESTEPEGSSTSNIEANEPSVDDGERPGGEIGPSGSVVTMQVEDLDEDGIPDEFTSTTGQCATGGCVWTIHLSKLGDGGTVFAQSISVLVHGTDDVATSFFAYEKGGCYSRFQKMVFDGTTYQPYGTGIDCNEVINRPEGAPIAQFEYQCMNVTPPECRGR